MFRDYVITVCFSCCFFGCVENKKNVILIVTSDSLGEMKENPDGVFD